MFESGVEAFLKKAMTIVREETVNLAPDDACLPVEFPRKPLENKVVWIDPLGHVITQYCKNHPVSRENIRTGDGKVRLVETSFGNVGIVICLDADFPSFVRQAGLPGAGLLLDPAQDSRRIDPLHTHMAAFRAIANGLAVVKPTGDGLSAVFDSFGRVLGRMDFWGSERKIMLADVPVSRVRTPYVCIGDLFAWLCMAGLAVLVGFGITRSQTKAVHSPL